MSSFHPCSLHESGDVHVHLGMNVFVHDPPCFPLPLHPYPLYSKQNRGSESNRVPRPHAGVYPRGALERTWRGELPRPQGRRSHRAYSTPSTPA